MKNRKIVSLLVGGLVATNLMASGVAMPNHELGESETTMTAAQLKKQKLAKQLSDPCSNLISIPLEFNTFDKIGPNGDMEKSSIKYMPVVPVKLTDNWNVIMRTVGEVVTSQDSYYPGRSDVNGLSDAIQSFFLSPTEMSPNGTRWGVGPAFHVPLATDKELGADQWGMGPTAAIINQTGGLTTGALYQHIWKVSGDDRIDDLNYSYFQPFVVYTTKTATSFSLSTESTYNFQTDDYEIPIIGQVLQIVPIGDQIFQFGLGAKYYVSDFENGPSGFGLRSTVTILLPRS